MTDDRDAERRAKRAAYQREWRARNRDAVNAAKRDSYAADPEKYQDAAKRGYRRMDPMKSAATRRAWLERNAAKVAQQARARVAAAPDRYRQYQRTHKLRKYGLTQDQYDAMVVEQGGVCAICGRRRELVLNVDHDHPTGVVRGLLCGSCNRALGLMDDDPRRLIRAAKYLRDRGAYIFNEIHETEGRST